MTMIENERPAVPVVPVVASWCTATGQRLHVPGCPHVGSPLREATPAQLARMATCSWCRAEIGGVGRTHPRTLVEAMRSLGCHEGTQRLIVEALRGVAHDEIWLPHSKSYIALGLEGRGAAWIGKGYVFVKATGAFVELPGYRAGGGGGTPREERVGEVCLHHFEVRSLTGACSGCDD
ncbi:hypothetical protein ENKNEFLB_03896 [Nocardioides aquaticus]|uniref:Uncharacterized protein n=2 Tax=Actinomycetes TaxID=1760 RepID=A0ABX8ELW0_9ACTN|nr:hypothetical protein [Nocardioides aquaticus]QVT81486.1 hypothetical protein ENKNEFLB_03896 [Nocardioides aquaticus]